MPVRCRDSKATPTPAAGQAANPRRERRAISGIMARSSRSFKLKRLSGPPDHRHPRGPPPHNAAVARPTRPFPDTLPAYRCPEAGPPTRRAIVRTQAEGVTRRGSSLVRQDRRRGGSAAGSSRAIYVNFFEVLWPMNCGGPEARRSATGRSKDSNQVENHLLCVFSDDNSRASTAVSRAAREIIRCKACPDYSAALATTRHWTSWRAPGVWWVARREGVGVVWVDLHTWGRCLSASTPPCFLLFVFLLKQHLAPPRTLYLSCSCTASR
ncbi:hypothetical protein E2C01_037415 [Portunus trituberculatus]|uniref:Uncharacterized protein n=1 Tax=Portunus trituberculatus TaxID=210409 RepID=A0A5B7FF94_PORTR|nr:hypothetical protein [Portunus trituberculatus]